MSKKIVFSTLTVVAVLSYGATASAELLASAVSKAEAETIEVGAALINSTVAMENRGDESDIERQMIPVYAAYGINDMTDVYAGIAMILKSKAKDTNIGDGDGFGWGGGLRSDLPFGDDFILRGYAQFFYISENYTNLSRRNLEGDGWFIDVGAMVMHEVSDELNIYAAVELAPLEDFEVKRSQSGRSAAFFDFERADFLTMRLGGRFNMETFFIRGEVAFAGEESFTIGAGMAF